MGGWRSSGGECLADGKTMPREGAALFTFGDAAAANGGSPVADGGVTAASRAATAGSGGGTMQISYETWSKQRQ